MNIPQNENPKKLKQTLFSYLNIKELSKSTKSIDLLRNSKRLILNTPTYKQYSDCYSRLTTSHTFKLPNISVYPIQQNLDMISLKGIYSPQHTHENKKKIKKTFLRCLNPISETNNSTKINDKLNLPLNTLTKTMNEYTFLKCVDQFNNTNNIIHKYIKYKDEYFIYKNKDRNLTILKEMLNQYTINEIVSEKSKKVITNLFTIHNDEIVVRFKFSSIKLSFYNEQNKKISQIIFNFKAMPFIYGISFQLFKTFLSLIIDYNYKTQTFSLNEEKFKAYYEYFLHNTEFYNNYSYMFIQNKQFIYTYDWIINQGNNGNIKYKMKLTFPYMSITMINESLNMKTYIRKSLDIPHVAYFISKDFEDWDFYLLNSFSIYRQFRIIVNNALSINNHAFNIKTKNIIKENLDYPVCKSQKSEISFEFFITHQNKTSHFYKLTAPKIKINHFIDKEHIDYYKIFQLTLKQAIQLNKFSYHYSIQELIKKCTNISKYPLKDGQYKIIDISLNIDDMIFNFDETLLEFFSPISARESEIRGNVSVVFLEPVIEWISKDDECFIKKVYVMERDKYKMMLDLPIDKFSLIVSGLSTLIEKGECKTCQIDEEISFDELKIEQVKIIKKISLKNRKNKKEIE